MKIFFAALLVLALAGGIAIAIQYDSGYILIAYGQTTVEMTFWVGAAVLGAILLLMFLLFSGLRRGARLGDKVGSFWSQRRLQRGRNKTNMGLIAFIEGNWLKARRLLVDGARETDVPLVNYLLAARASHALGEAGTTREYLALAEDTSERAGIAVELTQASLQLESGQLEEALATLTRARQNAERHPSVLKLLEQVYLGLNDWPALQQLIPELRRHNVLDAEQLQDLERRVLSGQLERMVQQGGAAQTLSDWWRKLGKAWQRDADLLLRYCRALHRLGEDAEIEKLLRAVLPTLWQPELLALYGKVAGDDPSRQLAVAESWLLERRDDPVLLVAVGRLCLRNELWGKAREYFDAAYRKKPTAEVCLELGRLLSALGEAEAGNRITREGLAQQQDLLPPLPQPRRLTGSTSGGGRR